MTTTDQRYEEIRTLFQRACASGVDLSWLDPILDRYAAPERHYHGLDHLVYGLKAYLSYLVRSTGHGLSGDEITDVALAYVFHDVVYDPLSQDNEELSAVTAVGHLRDVVGLDRAKEIKDMILATKHLCANPMMPFRAALLCDIDLIGFAANREIVLKNEENLRKEYAHVDDATWALERSKFLMSFCRRSEIYRTVYFSSRYETQARESLNYLLSRYDDLVQLTLKSPSYHGKAKGTSLDITPAWTQVLKWACDWVFVERMLHEESPSKLSRQEQSGLLLLNNYQASVKMHSPLPEPMYVVWNEAKTEGFITKDYQLAYEVRKSSDTNCHTEEGQRSNAGVGFIMDWGDTNCTMEKILSFVAVPPK